MDFEKPTAHQGWSREWTTVSEAEKDMEDIRAQTKWDSVETTVQTDQENAELMQCLEYLPDCEGHYKASLKIAILF